MSDNIYYVKLDNRGVNVKEKSLKRIPLKVLKNREVVLNRSIRNCTDEFAAGTHMFIKDKFAGFALSLNVDTYPVISCVKETSFDFLECYNG